MTAHALIIDRFEEGLAVVETEDGVSFTVPRTLLPGDATEGSWLRVRLELDPEATRSASDTVAALREGLVSDDGEDFAL